MDRIRVIVEWTRITSRFWRLYVDPWNEDQVFLRNDYRTAHAYLEELQSLPVTPALITAQEELQTLLHNLDWKVS